MYQILKKIGLPEPRWGRGAYITPKTPAVFLARFDWDTPCFTQDTTRLALDFQKVHHGSPIFFFF